MNQSLMVGKHFSAEDTHIRAYYGGPLLSLSLFIAHARVYSEATVVAWWCRVSGCTGRLRSRVRKHKRARLHLEPVQKHKKPRVRAAASATCRYDALSLSLTIFYFRGMWAISGFLSGLLAHPDSHALSLSRARRTFSKTLYVYLVFSIFTF